MRLLSALIWLCFALPVMAQDLTVFAAASLRDALTEIAGHYPADVTLSFAGSGTIARQVAAGAPVDAVVLAHRDWTGWLVARGLVAEGTIREVAGGALVLIGPRSAAPLANPDATSLITALSGGRLAIGQRDGVPAGTYARAWLKSIGAWDALQPHLAETDNVRAALALVAQGAAPLGVVYASDAQVEPKVAIVHRVPAQAHAPIRYPAAALTAAGADFIAYLDTDTARATFEKFGLTP
jgi:molybdate transport system substrate-binding protein